MAKPTPAGYNYTCNDCGASFVANEDLTEHQKQDHLESPQSKSEKK